MARNALKVLGPDTDIGVRRLIRWRLQGVRQLTVILAPQIEVSKPVVWWLSRAVREGIWRRLGRAGEKLWAITHSRRLSRFLRRYSNPIGDGVGSSQTLVAIGSLGLGGAEKQALLRARALAKEGKDVSVYLSTHETRQIKNHLVDSLPEKVKFNYQITLSELFNTDDLVPKTISYDDSPAEAIKRWKELWFLLPGDIWTAIYLAAHSMSSIRPTVIISYLDWTNVTVGLAAVLSGAKEVRLSFRSLQPGHYELFRHEFLGIYKALISLDRVSLEANSLAGLRSYTRWLSIREADVTYFANFIEPLEVERSRIAQKARDRGRPPVVGWLGRFSDQKDPMLWVSTLENLIRDRPEIRGVMAGDGPLAQETQDELLSRNLDRRVTMLGEVAESAEFLCSLDLLLTTSKSDGTPNVVVEACQLSLPVVATDSGDVALLQNNWKNLEVINTRDSERLALEVERGSLIAF